MSIVVGSHISFLMTDPNPSKDGLGWPDSGFVTLNQPFLLWLPASAKRPLLVSVTSYLFSWS